MRDIDVDLSLSGIKKLRKALLDYQKWLERKTDEFVKVLADRGCEFAQILFTAALYDGDNDVKVSVEQRGKNYAAVVAVGKSTLFIEFGAGYMLGYGHPAASEYGMGPGTYPGQRRAFSPNGWYFKDSGGNKVHSFGNPPAAPMYSAVKELEIELERIAREVFHD